MADAGEDTPGKGRRITRSKKPTAVKVEETAEHEADESKASKRKRIDTNAEGEVNGKGPSATSSQITTFGKTKNGQPVKANIEATNGKQGQADAESDEDIPILRRKRKKIVIKSEPESEEELANGDQDKDNKIFDPMSEDIPLWKARNSKGSIKKLESESEGEEDVSSQRQRPVRRASVKVKKSVADDSDDEENRVNKRKRYEDSDSDFHGSDSEDNKKALGKSAQKTKKPQPVKKKQAVVEKSKDDSPKANGKKALSKTATKTSVKKTKMSSSTTKASSSSSKVTPSTPNKEKSSASKVKDSNGKQEGTSKKSKKGKTAEDSGDDEDQDDEYKWWKENAMGDGSIKWQTLQHNGVLFPPEYDPHGVKMKFDGKEIYLTPEAEEVASFYAAMLNSEHLQNETFRRNFFADWVQILKKSSKNPKINDYDRHFEKCDFNPIFEHFEREKERKKNMSKAEKQVLKEEKLKIEEKYGYCMLDGRKEKVGNFRIEPPGLFRGRGSHPKTGKLKMRVQPEQVTINIGKDAKVPEAPKGHKWGKVVNDNTVTWLATWKENVNQSVKYVFLAANSSLKGQSDFKKFEKARELKGHVDRIRTEYTHDLKDRLMETRQRATAMYLIDKFALRAGNEKDTEGEADTVGCCSLRIEHITLQPPKTVIFDFLGKDSIRYYNEVSVDEQVYKNLSIFKRKPKEPTDLLFDRLTTISLNKHLSTYMPGLTAKVFRTFNASFTFQNELKDTPEDGTVPEKILHYNRANRQVALLCNHQRTVSKAHENQMNRITDKIRALKYQRRKYRHTVFTIDPKMRRKRPELEEDESDLEEEWIVEYEKQLIEKEKEKARAKFEKENEKLAENNQPLKSEKELRETLHEIDIKEKTLLKERQSGRVEPKRGQTLEKLEESIKKVDERIAAAKLTYTDKDENKQTALGTSKINYIDPRISAAWCYKYRVPIEKIFNKSLREKFKWALEVEEDWEF